MGFSCINPYQVPSKMLETEGEARFLSFPAGPGDYCKFRILFSQIASKNIFAALKYSQLEHDLTISVNVRVITPFREGLIFT